MSAQFWSALFSIVVIDLVLAGDNAIVIALAARNLPERLRLKAIIGGTVGAIAVRSSLTMLVVWLLAIPGLSLAGGAILVWIAYKLLRPEDDDDGVKIGGANNFWRAIGTIIFADIVMGLDNVLGVAGAAHGNFMLVVFGLLISIPIVVWGSTLVLRIIQRFPAFVYIGAAVLAWTAAKMIVSEPLLAAFYAQYPAVSPALFLVITIGVLVAGMKTNHRKVQFKISERLAQRQAARIDSPTTGGKAMRKVLVPIDGSRNSLHAVRHVVNAFMQNTAMEVHLLNVQSPLSRHAARFLSRRNRDQYHRDRGNAALAGARRQLDKFGVPHSVMIEVGDKAEIIAREARRLHCDEIVMATARKNSFTRMLQDSTTNRVLELTNVPVEVIAGDAVSNVERWGLPAALAATLAALFMIAAD